MSETLIFGIALGFIVGMIAASWGHTIWKRILVRKALGEDDQPYEKILGVWCYFDVEKTKEQTP